MNNTVTFRNRGLIDLRAVKTFGVSAKECGNPIGFFGTGLKYAIAICLRLGCKITLYRGLECVEFATADIAVRNSDFRVVTMNGEEIGFTTDLGKTWEPWQAFRELYCNTMDEGGEVLPSAESPQEEFTTIVVRGAPIYSAYLERHKIVLNAKPKWARETIEIHDRPTECAYYRGVRVGNLEHPCIFTYNVLQNLDLTEDRTLKNVYQFYARVRQAILSSEDAAFITRVLTAPTTSFESRLDLDSWDTPSETFLKTLEEVTFRCCSNPTALRVYKKHRKTVLMPDATPLTSVEAIQLRRAVEFCKWSGYNVEDYPIVVTTDLEDKTWGCVYEGSIYLNRSAFMAGTKIVAGTLIEEYLHLRMKFRDESRDFQNYLLNALVSMAERAKGEPI